MSLIIYDVSKSSNISVSDLIYKEQDILFFTGSSTSTEITINTTVPCTLIFYNLSINLSKGKTKCPLFLKGTSSYSLTYLGQNTLISGENTCAIKLGPSLTEFSLNSPTLSHSLSLQTGKEKGGILKVIPTLPESLNDTVLSFLGGTTTIHTNSVPSIGVLYQTKKAAKTYPHTAFTLRVLDGCLTVNSNLPPAIGYKNGEVTKSTLALSILHGALLAHSSTGTAIDSATQTTCTIEVSNGLLSDGPGSLDLPTMNAILEEPISESNTPQELSGTIFIEEHAPKCHDTIHGILSDIAPSNATFKRQWIRVPLTLSTQNEVIVGTEESYTLTPDDVGYLINYRLIGTGNYCGTIECRVGPIPKMDGQEAPDRPELLSKSQTTLQVKERNGEEYAIRQATTPTLKMQTYGRTQLYDSKYGNWQSSGTFDHLIPDTQYQLIARCQFDQTSQEPSAISRPCYATTLRIPFLAKASRNKIYGLTKVYFPGETISFRAQGTGVNIDSPIEGDTRYIPYSYSILEEKSWADEPYIASLTLDTPGEYELKVCFHKEQFEKRAWIDTGEFSDQFFSFTVTYGD